VTPSVSIVTSCYNDEHFIGPFLRDITRQTVFHQCELLFVDCSPKSKIEMVRPYLSSFSNIAYFHTSGGIYEAWRFGIERARGRYITNANLDDRRAPYHIERHANFLEMTGYDLVCADLLPTRHANETWEYNSHYQRWAFTCNSRITMDEMFEVSEEGVKPRNAPHCAPVWRKDIHDRYGWFNNEEPISADWEFWLRCLSKGAVFGYIPEPMTLYYDNPKGFTNTRDEEATRKVNQRIIETYRCQLRTAWIN
jgi:glycosyltransferase involved in cell wall biosynthesis